MFSSGTCSDTPSGYVLLENWGKLLKQSCKNSQFSGVPGDKFLYSGTYILRLYLDLYFGKAVCPSLQIKNVQKQNKNVSAI